MCTKLFDNIAEQYDRRQRLCLVEMCTNHRPFIEDLGILGKANANETAKEPSNETTNQPSNQAKACHIQAKASQSHNKPSQPARQPTKASHNQTQPHPANASHVYSLCHAKSEPWNESGSGSVVMHCLNPQVQPSGSQTHGRWLYTCAMQAPSREVAQHERHRHRQ